MSVIPNKWTEKDKPKKEQKKSGKDNPASTVAITRSNMTKTLRGVRK